MNQLEMVSLEQMVLPNHRYRRFKKVWDFKKVDLLLSKAETDNPHKGYGIKRIFRCLLLHFLTKKIQNFDRVKSEEGKESDVKLIKS